MSEPWVEKYKPRRLRHIVGQSKAVQDIARWAESWKRGRPSKSTALFYGPPGTGKSAAAAALAQEFRWDFVEMNASDQRTFAKVEQVAGTAATAGTLLAGAGGKRLVVLDEADNVYGRKDRGGYRAIKDIVGKAANPVILIANDKDAIPWDIKASCLMANFGRLRDEKIIKELERVSRAEKIDANPVALKVIAETVRGDLRSAVNDLQTLASGKRKLSVKDLTLYRRDHAFEVGDFLRRLLESTSAKEARELMWSLNMKPEDALVWIDENIPKMILDLTSRVKVYDAISRADVFLGRARRKRAYKLWGYASDLMSAGVWMSRGERLKPFDVKFPSHIRRYARTRVERSVRDAVAKKVAARCHTSSRVARKNIIPYLRVLFKHDKKAASSIAGELELTGAEVAYLR